MVVLRGKSRTTRELREKCLSFSILKDFGSDGISSLHWLGKSRAMKRHQLFVGTFKSSIAIHNLSSAPRTGLATTYIAGYG